MNVGMTLSSRGACTSRSIADQGTAGSGEFASHSQRGPPVVPDEPLAVPKGIYTAVAVSAAFFITSVTSIPLVSADCVLVLTIGTANQNNTVGRDFSVGISDIASAFRASSHGRR